jgi:thiol-disulfide isomerase/thioredoxin
MKFPRSTSPVSVCLSCLVFVFMAVLNGWCDEAPAGYIEPHSALFLKNASEGAKELLKEGKLKTLQELSAAAPDTSPIARPPLSTEKLDGPDLHDRLLASTLMVGLYPAGQNGDASIAPAAGFAVAKGGIITTCAHVMQFDSKQMVTAYPIAVDAQGKVYPIVEVLAYDPVADTCILRVGGGNFPPIPLRKSARTGENAYCLSHPGGNFFIFTSGIVSRQDTEEHQGRTVKKLDVSCEYSPGSSGAPITDACGNAIAQVDKILPSLVYADPETQTGTAATVYNLRIATSADEIIRLFDPANRTPIVTPLFNAKMAAAAHGSFQVHTLYALVAAPKDVALDKQATNFDQLFKLITQDPHYGTRHPTFDAWSSGPQEAQQPNFLPFGFGGNTGYYQDEKSKEAKEPMSMHNTTWRGIDFKVTYHDVKGATVQAAIAVNDTRATPMAADNKFDVEATITRNQFQLVRLGPPQQDRQAWLALFVDDFSAPATKLPTPELKLGADHRVDLKFTTLDKQEVDTSKLRGKVILVDFWATWCGPCIQSLPVVAKLYEKYHSQGLDVFGISLDHDRATLDGFLKKNPHPWPQTFTEADPNPIADRFGITSIPAFILIDKTGVATVIDARNPDTDDIIAAKLRS